MDFVRIFFSSIALPSLHLPHHLATTVQNILDARTVLLLGDNQAGKLKNLADQLEMNGLKVTYISNGITEYSGTPVASSFDVVVLITGDAYSVDMPVEGQQAILNAQQLNGTGVIMTEWATFMVLGNRWQFLSPLLLAQRISETMSNITFSLVLNNHPIWNDLPSIFTSKVSMGMARLSSVYDGAQVVSNATESGSVYPGVIVKLDNGTAGRLVQIAHAAYYSSIFNWINDNNITMMMVNAVRWAAKLI